MPRFWSNRVDRALSDGLDSDLDRDVQSYKAHKRHDADRSAEQPSGDTSGPSCDGASTPKKRGWFS